LQWYFGIVVIAMLTKNRKIHLSEYRAKVTYCDPCYLGRHNEVYDIPRMILKSIPGLELIEMTRNRENAFCCGSGGGNFFTDLVGLGEKSPSRIRVQDALDTGAEVLAIACPMRSKLDDAVKSEELVGENQSSGCSGNNESSHGKTGHSRLN
jgi:Fe-S oxidoreductase